MVGKALVALLQGVGYDTHLVEDHPKKDPEELFDGVKLLLVAPAPNPSSSSSAFSLADLRGKLGKGMAVPVLTLSTTAREALTDQPGVVLWPCRLEDLTEKIEAALFPEPEVGVAS